MDEHVPGPEKRHYIWPRYLWAMVILGIVIAVIWMSVAAHTIRESRDPNYVPPGPAFPTDSASATNDHSVQ
jgi:hypothetical protein